MTNMDNNQRFNVPLNNCQNPRAVYNALAGLTPGNVLSAILELSAEQQQQLWDELAKRGLID